MTEKTMTLAEALEFKNHLKRKIDKRIKIINLSIVLFPNNAESKKKIAEYENKIRDVYKSLNTLSTNYDIMSTAIAAANAKAKTDIMDSDGKPMTVAQLLSIISNDSIAHEISKALEGSYERTKKELSKYKPNEVVFVDPLESARNSYIEMHDMYIEKVKNAIHKANAKTKIKVNLVD